MSICVNVGGGKKNGRSVGVGGLRGVDGVDFNVGIGFYRVVVNT